ncbi:MAG: NADH-quinone oxidoreductase subunit C [Methanomassiliicoccales archaeon]|nr:NADH-quinone oxidoreductase subunit C [Methanomassiliicoccales archaeon]MDD1755895.1 NADH-quinone oxidoreductase subunit C [Methanomassiliicoccales archaeon]
MTESRMQDILRSMPEELSDKIKSRRVKGNEMWLEVELDAFAQVAAHIHNLWGASIVTFHGVDNRIASNDLKLVLVLALKGEEDFAVLLTSMDPEHPSFRSLTPDIPCADWYEREMHDLLGMVPVGHPDPRPLVLYDDWPIEEHPLLKDFPAEKKVQRLPSSYTYHRVEGEGVFEIPVGPVHAGVIEPGHFRFSVAGEPILNLEIRLGYAHKGTEKLFERLTYEKGVFLAERISGDNSFSHSLAFCQAVEGMTHSAPERAEHLRTAFAELERIHCLLGDVGGIALDVAFNVAAQHAYIMRERALDLNDYLAGSRLLRGINCLGGVRMDIPAEKLQRTLSELIRLKLDLKEFASLVFGTQSVLDRTEATGAVSLVTAKDLNLVGPVARASGLDRDVRRDHPYAAYRHMSFRVPVRYEGDVQARLLVKLDELNESISIVEQALGGLPSGAILDRVVDVEEGKTSMGLVESPRGELVHWTISGESNRPLRHKVRDASFHNWRAMETAVLGNIVPDFPLINKSFNLSYSGSDL